MIINVDILDVCGRGGDQEDLSLLDEDYVFRFLSGLVSPSGAAAAPRVLLSDIIWLHGLGVAIVQAFGGCLKGGFGLPPRGARRRPFH